MPRMAHARAAPLPAPWHNTYAPLLLPLTALPPACSLALPPLRSSYKSRFKVTGTGKVVYARPGHVHKRFNKSKSQLLRLGGPLRVMRPRYAKVVRKLGFKTRNLS